MTLTEMRARVRRLLGNVTSTDYSDNDIDESINEYYQTFTTTGIESSGEWRSSGEIATTNVVANQAEYIFPVDFITIDRVEVNFTGDTNQWERVRIIDDRAEFDAISNANGKQDSAIAYLHDNSIFFFDAPTANSTAGLKIWYSKDPTELTASVSPNLPNNTHDGLVYGACLDFSLERKLTKEIELFKVLYNEKSEEVKDYYANRTKVKRIRVVPRTESYV